MDPFSILLGVPWQAIGAGVVAFSTGAVTVGTNGATLWGNLQKLRQKPEPTQLRSLLGKGHDDVLKLADEIDKDVRPLAASIIRRQLVLYICAGLLVALVSGVLVAVVVGVLPVLFRSLAWSIPTVGVSAAVGWGVSQILKNPNDLFQRAVETADEWYRTVVPADGANSIASQLPVKVAEFTRAFAGLQSTAVGAWEVVQSHVTTTEERRLVEQFVLTDTLIRNLWAHALTLKIVQIRRGLAPALRDAVGEALAAAVRETREAFKPREGTVSSSPEWRERNKAALTAVFTKLGLGDEFTRDLTGGFLDNDFYALAVDKDPKALKERLAGHPMFRPTD